MRPLLAAGRAGLPSRRRSALERRCTWFWLRRSPLLRPRKAMASAVRSSPLKTALNTPLALGTAPTVAKACLSEQPSFHSLKVPACNASRSNAGRSQFHHPPSPRLQVFRSPPPGIGSRAEAYAGSGMSREQRAEGRESILAFHVSTKETHDTTLQTLLVGRLLPRQNTHL